MTYLNFTKVAPAAPNDPLVNVGTQLNANWDEMENKTAFLAALGGGQPPNLEIGQEYAAGAQKNFWVYNGIGPRTPLNYDQSWSAWTTLPLSANVVVRPGWTPKYRVNTDLRLVELTGGIMKDAPGSAWPAGLITITTGTSGPTNTQGPIGGLSFQESASALPVGGNGAGGYHRIDVLGGFVRIQTQYVGSSGGGNFISLNGLSWWF